MAEKKLDWLLVVAVMVVCCQRVDTTQIDHHGICKSMFCNSMEALMRLKNCTVVLGNLHVLLLERTKREHFNNVSFPKLKEITGFLVVYRVRGLDSLGHLFPSLTRIRGAQLLYNYALIVYDMPNLKEIGLYNLLKIDRGGVIIWGAPQACFVDTVNWKAIAPQSRHVLSVAKHSQCNIGCTCTTNPSTNHCWNNRKCQRYLDGPEGEKCKSQCLGCRKTNSGDCSVCRRYTFREQCVSKCPNGTVILPVNSYCLTTEECHELGGWPLNSNCVFECPINYVKTSNNTCRWCKNCTEVCGSQVIRSLETIQAAGRCVYINGSLTIHISSIPETVKELKMYLSELQEVSDSIIIYGSITITSLDFLPSLKRIRGEKLEKGRYSLVVYDMRNLQSLFLSNVTKNLKVDRGTVNFYGNPILCMSHIEKLQEAFPTKPNEIDVPQGMNGYSGGCKEVSLGLQVKVLNETSALVLFRPEIDDHVHYTVLYVKLPHGSHATFVPETCSESEWFAVDVHTEFSHVAMVQLTQLHPASHYAICVETYNTIHRNLARSSILSFQTLVGKPEPPFILELVASLPEAVVIRWVDHRDYISNIVRYELDVILIEIRSEDVTIRDHCKRGDEDYDELDYSRHAVVLKPPPNYETGCKSMCGVLSSVTEGALTEEYFEVCSNSDFECDVEEASQIKNSWTTVGNYVKTLSLNISGPRNDFQVGGLAPFRDYKFKLRACTENFCSKSTRGVVRTLRKHGADIPVITSAEANLTGYLTIHWNPPVELNGPVLSYNVEVLPKIVLNDINNVLPQVWCTSSNTTSITVRSEIAMKYVIRVCTTTLGSSKSCSEWRKTYISIRTVPTWWWSGILFGIVLYIVSIGFGRLCNKRRYYIDRISLIDNTVTYRNETEPPSLMMSDFAPVYSVSLHHNE